VVPVRIRRLLNVESGLNDGLATPVVLFAIAAIVGSGETSTAAGAVVEIAIGVAVGAAVGGLAGALFTASRRRGWSGATARSIGLVVLPAGAYAAAGLLHGNGFVAAFVTGTALAAAARWITEEKSALELTGSVADLLGFAVWFLLGLAITNIVGDLRWSSLVYALASLTVVRMLPVWIALVGTRLRLRTVAFIGWFGPRGLASVVFVLLAVEAIPESSTLNAVMATVLLTVALSVLFHGASADVLADRYGAWVQKAQPQVETQASVEPHRRSPHRAPATSARTGARQ
jgi:sodium/hydrogen antiporter